MVFVGTSRAPRGQGGRIQTRSQPLRSVASQVQGQVLVNVITKQEASHSKKLISGTIFANSRRVCALFDTEATHSFVSQVYVDRVGMAAEEAEETLVVVLLSDLTISVTKVCKN